MPTKQQQNLIDRIAKTPEDDDRVAAASLSCSLGKGEGDEWSDVDILALVREAKAPEVSATTTPLIPMQSLKPSLFSTLGRRCRP